MKRTVLFVVLACQVCLASIAAQDAEDGQNGRDGAEPAVRMHGEMRKMSNKQLLETARRLGLALSETQWAITDGPFSKDWTPPSPEAQRFHTVSAEILRRGVEMEPLLIDFIVEEAPQQRKANQIGDVTSFTNWAIRNLLSMRSKGAVPALVKILDGFDGKVSREERVAALEALEPLTYHTFRPLIIEYGQGGDAIEHPETNAADTDLGRIADLYGKWLEVEGSDPDQWLTLACKRARKMLQSSDPRQVYLGAKFLSQWQYEPTSWRRYWRDAKPGSTLTRVVEIMKEVKVQGNAYVWRGKRLPGHCGHWIYLITCHGPRARTYSDLLIRLETGYGPDRICTLTLSVGGERLMAYYIQNLPKLRTRNALQSCRYAIDRWAGRLFDSDDERVQWWKKNRHKTQEQWLRDSLPVLAEQAGRPGNPGIEASSLAKRILPDLPMKQNIAAGDWNPRADNSVEWLKEHKSRLKYDEQKGAFRLREGNANVGTMTSK